MCCHGLPRCTRNPFRGRAQCVGPDPALCLSPSRAMSSAATTSPSVDKVDGFSRKSVRKAKQKRSQSSSQFRSQGKPIELTPLPLLKGKKEEVCRCECVHVCVSMFVNVSVMLEQEVIKSTLTYRFTVNFLFLFLTNLSMNHFLCTYST